MRNVITIKTSESKNPELTLNTANAIALKLMHKKNICVSFGCAKHYADLKIDDSVSEDSLVLSKKLLFELHLPEYPEYEIKANGNELVIGPYIGLLITKDDRNITSSTLNKMLVYVKRYSELHGAVIVFALDKIDAENLLIEGYCYNPKLNFFQKGVFPYPGAFYRKVGLSALWKNHFLSCMGDKFFNNHYFNKWEMYKWMSEEEDMSTDIPYTLPYSSESDVFDMLERFDEIYIKPVSGLGGRGIAKISTDGDTLTVRHRENGQNRTESLEDRDRAKEYIHELFCDGRYLIQQGIKLIKYNEGVIDFRCIMQKDGQGQWKCSAIIGRCGEKNSIVSNISSGGRAFNAYYLIKKAAVFPETDTGEIVESIESFALKVCEKLDEYGFNFGTLGLDVGVDAELNLWLIEINNRDPDPTIALDVNDMELYYNLKTNPMFYVKYLAGFPHGADE